MEATGVLESREESKGWYTHILGSLIDRVEGEGA